MPRVREFAVARIADWIHSGDWGGWAACQAARLSRLCEGLALHLRWHAEGGKGPDAGKGACDLCENEVLANDEGVRYCARRHKQWGKAQDRGALRVRCNVYVCKACADAAHLMEQLLLCGKRAQVNIRVMSWTVQARGTTIHPVMARTRARARARQRRRPTVEARAKKDSCSDAEEEEEVEAIVDQRRQWTEK